MRQLLIIAVSSCVVALSMRVDAAIPKTLMPGVSLASARSSIEGGAFKNVRWLKRSEHQALAEGLVRTKLLETLNRLQLAPIDKEVGGLDGFAFLEIAIADEGERRYTFVFDQQSALRFALIRIPVPVDPAAEKGSVSRLHRLRDALSELERAGFALKEKSKDRYGNVFVWSSSAGTASLKAVYLPEDDELRVVLHDR